MLKKTKIKILALIAATVQAASLLSGCSLFPAEEEPSVPGIENAPADRIFLLPCERGYAQEYGHRRWKGYLYLLHKSFVPIGRRNAQGDPCDAWSDRFGGRSVDGARQFRSGN